MKFAIIDGRTVTSMADVHAALAQQLAFPEWYGGNLDALHDCLTETAVDIQITLVEPDLLPALLHMLQDCAEENPHIRLLTF